MFPQPAGHSTVLNSGPRLVDAVAKPTGPHPNLKRTHAPTTYHTTMTVRRALVLLAATPLVAGFTTSVFRAKRSSQLRATPAMEGEALVSIHDPQGAVGGGWAGG